MMLAVLLMTAVQLAGPNAARVAAIAEHLPASPVWTGEAFPSNPARARADLKKPIPDCSDDLYLLTTRTGNRTRYQAVYFARLEQLKTLVGTFRTTGDTALLGRAVELIEAICAERSWTMPAHDLSLSNFHGTKLTIDLGSSHRAHALAGALSQLGDRLPAAVRTKAMAELERRVFSVYRATNRDSGDAKKLRTHGNWWFFGHNNWNGVCHAGVVRAALAVLPDRTDRAAFVEAAERAMPYYLGGFLDDGYSTEGMGYWNYGFGNFIELAREVKRATGGFVDFAKLPRAEKAMAYGFTYTLDGRSCPVFADGGGGRANERFLDWGCELWPALAARRGQPLPPRTYFPNAQVYIGRSTRMSLGLKGGTNAEMHNHNDLGSWSLLVDGEMVAGDPGGEVYTARTFSSRRYESDVLNSYGHPVPRVGGELQLEGAASRAEILRTDFSEARDVVTIDLSSAYRATRGKKGALVREVTFDRVANAVTVVDRLKVPEPVAFESAVVTYRKECPLLASAAGGAWHLESKDLENPGKPTPHRHAAVFDAPVAEGTVTWRFKVAQSAEGWHGGLWLGRGGYWRNRVAVSVTNVTDSVSKHGGIAVRIPALKGTRSAEWRVVGADGAEFEYAVADGETIVLPTEAGPKGAERFYVYWNNPDAWPLIDPWPHPADKTGALRATVGPVESLVLHEIGADAPWAAGDWDYRVAVRVFNFTDESSADGVASIDADEVTRATRSPRILLTREGREVKPFRTGSILNFPAAVPPLSVVTYWAYVKGGEPGDERQSMPEADRQALMALVRSRANLLQEPLFAERGAKWSMCRAKGGRADVVDDAVFGRASRLVSTPAKEADDWVGRVQRVKVRPDRSYLVGACLRGESVATPSTVHFHVEGAGKPSFGAAPQTQAGTFGWTPFFGLAKTAADTRTISVHLTMSSTGTLYHAAALLAEVCPCAVGRVEPRPIRPQAFVAAQVPSVVKVFRETPFADRRDPWRISLARNETEELQVAVRSGADGAVAVKMSTPTDAAGGRLTVETGIVGYVPVDFPTAYYGRDTPERVVRTPDHAKSCDGFTGWWPDPVEPGGMLSLEANEAGAVRFSVRADAAAKPGVYRAEVTWARDGRVFRRDPVEIEVWGFTLPERPSFAATYDVRLNRPWWRAPGEKDDAAARKRVLDAMAKHAICPDSVAGNVRCWKEQDGTVKADFSDYDRLAEEFFGHYRFPSTYMPHMFYCFGWGHPPGKFLGEAPYEGEYPYDGVDRSQLRPAYKRAYQQALRLFWEHAKEKGWSEKLVLYISDEPHFHLKPVHDQMIALCRMIHEVDPAIRIYSSTWRHCPDWDESLDVWGVGAHGCFPTDEMTRLAKRGKGIWFTTDGHQCLDTPLCAIERMQGIFCWAYGAEKYEFWGCTWLTADPWKFGWHQFIRQGDVPGEMRWVRYPSGDGYHFYPPRDAAKDARPVPSLRVQAIRDGVEEVAYLKALEIRAEKGVAEAKALLADYRALVPIPNAGGRYSTKILPDPAKLENLRTRAARLLSSIQ